MILDQTTLFSDQQAITATAASTNSIDLGAMGTVANAAGPLVRRLVAGGDGLPLMVQVTEAFNNLTSLKIDIELDSTTTFTPDKTITLGTYLLAELVKGFQIPWRYVPDGINLRYAQLKYTVTGTAPTLGKISAGIVADVQTAA